MAIEERTARLTVLIDPRKKAVFERLCVEADTTPSQVVRQMIRGYISERLGKPWTPDATENVGETLRGARTTKRQRAGASR